MFESAARTHPRMVMPLAALTRRDIATAGGKGANLGELTRTGFPVPPGFVLTTDAYDALLETGVGDDLVRLLDAGADPADVRRLIRSAGMPAGVRDELAAAYAQLGAPAVAVRSSATAEDLPGATFAGQQDTELNVVGFEQVVAAVQRCWASLWTDRAVAYRRERSIDPASVRMAVVVQTMVRARAAGVMFSANPVTGRRDEVVIDAGAGLGEAVVSGRVTPEHYVLDAEGRLRNWVDGEGEVVISAVAGGGTREDAGRRAGVPLLTRAQQTRLAELAHRAADAFGQPQDLEWAVADDRVWIVQARPLTALPPEPRKLSAFERRIGPFYLEMFTTRPYPLDVTAWFTPAIVEMLRRMTASIGVRFPAPEDLLVEQDGVVVALIPPKPRPTWRMLGAPLSLARRVRRFRVDRWTTDPRFIAHAAEVERLRGLDLAALDWGGLLRVVEDAIAATGLVSDLRTDYLPAAFLPQIPLRLMLLVLGRSQLSGALLAGAPSRTREANDALEDLARTVRDDPTLSEVFERTEQAGILRRLPEPAFDAFRLRFEEFLRRYGHRETVSVVLVSAPTWSDAPEVVLGLVKVLVAAPRRSAKAGDDALRELLAHPLLRSGVRRSVARLVAAVREGVALREDTHFFLTMTLPPLRRALIELGSRLVDGGILDGPLDVFHLRLEEMRALQDGAYPSPRDRERMRRLVADRRARRAELGSAPLAQFPADRPAIEHADTLLTGTPASRGRATGPVRVIHEPSEFGRLRAGEVLVCPYTNPAWTPLFPRAAAVVVDTGGVASHAAIVAREYGIPAVMGTRAGTSRLVDGQLVTVDGTAGVVLRGEAMP